MKTFNTVFAFLFFSFALLQYNDPDPYLWIPIYLISSAICLMNVRGKFRAVFHYGTIVFCLVYALVLFFDKNGVISWYTDHDRENLVQSMKAAKPWIEETREFGGLLIITIVMVINLMLQKKSGAQ